MINKKPEGYKDLLAYKKAAELQELNLQLTDLFPRAFAWLKEQMDKSGRSGTKNIIEGWKRNTTPEYFTFLGYSIAAIEELKDDAADIAKGLYQPLMNLKGVMGETGEKGRAVMGEEEKGLERVSNPIVPINPLPPFSPSSSPLSPSSPSVPFPLSPLTP